jgi:hypothetical protein
MSFVLRIRPIVTRETAEVYAYHEGKRKGWRSGKPIGTSKSSRSAISSATRTTGM